MILKWKFKLEMENNDGFLETPQIKLKVFEMVLEKSKFLFLKSVI